MRPNKEQLEEKILSAVYEFNGQVTAAHLDLTIKELQNRLSTVFFRTLDDYISNSEEAYLDKKMLGEFSYKLHNALNDVYLEKVFW